MSQAAGNKQLKGAMKQYIWQAELLSVVPYAAGEMHTGHRQLEAGEQIASKVVCRQLHRARADRSVRAVVLRLDSPGLTCCVCPRVCLPCCLAESC
jgi:ClpP class serine protease